MTYTESSTLMQDATFRGRVKVACLKFADSILNESPGVPGHGARYRWATQCQFNPEQTAQNVTPPTVMDGAVQTAGAEVTDNALQGSVEAIINKMI
jgi:hypothetical protein